jgi:hypothetical protein
MIYLSEKEQNFREIISASEEVVSLRSVDCCKYCNIQYMIQNCKVNQVEVNKAIPCVMWRMKTVVFLAKQTGFKMEEKEKHFRKV